jgi:hypothetical protein
MCVVCFYSLMKTEHVNRLSMIWYFLEFWTLRMYKNNLASMIFGTISKLFTYTSKLLPAAGDVFM